MDDGLVLNLATGGPTAPKKEKVSGGRWKDRAKAKRASNKEHRKAAGDSRPVLRNPDSSRVSKPKPKPKEKSDRPPRPHDPNRVQYAIRKVKDADKKHGKETFVSSLFSSNPDHEPQQQQQDGEQLEAHEASNAPLKDSTEFEGIGINEKLCTELSEKMGLERPTRIQRAVLPRLLDRERDLFIQAETGSGKTLAYCLPIIERLMQCKFLDRTSGLFAVILAPTRELSTQILSVLQSLVRCCHYLVPGIVTGGENKKMEKQRIRKGVNILVGTPGRLADHIQTTEALDLSQVRWVVMDEGDMLMELGFEETITTILDKIEDSSRLQRTLIPELPKHRINVLCSATMKSNVKKLSQRSLSSNAETVTSDSVEGQETEQNGLSIAPAQLIQNCVIVPAKLRLVTLASTLIDLVQSDPKSSIIVFFSCADSVDFHFDAFSRDGVNTNRAKEDEDEDKKCKSMTAPSLGKNVLMHKIHGSLSQHVRRATLAAFKKPHDGASILFSTDLLSRGVDLPMVTNIVEFDPPAESEEHLHRVGRTARAGAAGSSIIFLLPGTEEKYVDVLNPLHPNGIQQKSYQTLLQRAFGKAAWETEATTWHLNTERWVLQDEQALEQARRGFKSHVRAYMTHIASERHIFDRQSLHLGHLAKAFALRDPPGSEPTSKKPKREKDPKKRMLAMARKHANSSANEFNLGY